jgi:catechol 2,3-dioxygenase-like lactoylglutathione lyase family enzyme
MANLPKINGLYHFAFPCRDAEETRVFYEDVLGLPLVHCMMPAAVPSSGESTPYAHIFFEMGDGSYIAFFDLGRGEMPERSPNTPDWVQHLALEVDELEDLEVFKERLEKAGVEVRGLVDHEFIKSIYFFDPNGLRLEITKRTEEPGFIEHAARVAHEELAEWGRKKAALNAAASATATAA